MSPSAGRSRVMSCAPASVGATLRVVRASSGTPKCSSNPLIAWLSAEVDTPSRFAARVKLRSSATVRNADKGLEEHFGVPLLARTTRSVAPTDAGAQLITRLRPALGDIRGALDQISGLRDRPAGRVRLVVSPIAATTVLVPKLGQFARDSPDVVLDVTTDESRVDLVAGRFDAGIHFGEFIERDMITFRVSKDHRPAIVG